jgi:GAF domain-containing protein
MPIDQLALASTLQHLLSTIDLPAGTDGAALIANLNRVMDAAREVLHVDGAGLMLVDDAGGLRVVGVTGPATEALERSQQQLGVGPGIDCVRSGATVMVSDLADHADYLPLWRWLESQGRGSDVRAVLSAPVRVAGDTIGTLNALRSQPHEWIAEESRAVEAYANIIGVLLRLTSSSFRDMIDSASAGPAE